MALPDPTLFDTDGGLYLGSRRDPAGCRVGLFGVPYDGTTSFRPGTRFGPGAIREVSSGLETYCPQLGRDLEELAFADLGAVAIPFGDPEPVVAAVGEATQAVLNLGLAPLMLGGEHSISSGAVAAVAARHPDLVLVQLDAHADLRDTYHGSACNHACAVHWASRNVNLVQVGIRSMDESERAFEQPGNVFYGWDCHARPDAEWMTEALARCGAPGTPLYLTIDLDAFDPSILPDTGTPEPGGLGWYQVLTFTRMAMERFHIVGFDVVELAAHAHSKPSDFLAAKLVYKLLTYALRPERIPAADLA
jgi:agmatinase